VEIEESRVHLASNSPIQSALQESASRPSREETSENTKDTENGVKIESVASRDNANGETMTDIRGTLRRNCVPLKPSVLAVEKARPRASGKEFRERPLPPHLPCSFDYGDRDGVYFAFLDGRLRRPRVFRLPGEA